VRVLSFDGGAFRMGWGCIEGGPKVAPVYIGSGIEGITKMEGEKDQAYRLRLIEFWCRTGPALLDRYEPDLVATETLPLFGGDGFSNNVQSKLVATALTTLQAMCVLHRKNVTQIAAISVKARIGGTKKASKVAVRNGVITLLPDLAPRKFDWTESKKAMDEPDALGVGLVALGYTTKNSAK
jgi:Holliday junction resolvasome RuvABC endonuclease subunit